MFAAGPMYIDRTTRLQIRSTSTAAASDLDIEDSFTRKYSASQGSEKAVSAIQVTLSGQI